LKRGGVLAHVTIVGSISDADVLAELKTIALQEGIPEQVTFAGSRPVDELAALYRSATAVVLTSAVESFALPLLEAMASGTAVIASDIPVAREVCGDAAQFYPPGDVDALAASIRRALHDRRWRGDAVARGLARARLFSWQKAALQIGASFIAANAAFSDRRMVLSG
jgi:glycosyltransferase involved in cell wall biosynthesis